MKIDYISDTHIDFRIKEINPNSPKLEKEIIKLITNLGMKDSDSETLIIAGDIGHYFRQDSLFLKMSKNYYKNVIVVRGNHDMYLIGSQQSKYKHSSSSRYNKLKEFCKNNEIYYLDGDIIEIDGIKIGGVGMSWDKSYLEILQGETSDFEASELFKRTMNDARLIMEGMVYNVNTAYGGGFLKTTFNQLEYFEEEMKKLRSIKEADVMVSHYYPLSNILPDGYPESYKDDPSSTFYMFDGEKEVQRINPKYWIFGHMHRNYNFFYNNTNLLCNPLGYPSEYSYGKVMTIEL